jgi:type IV pilus assembly protein PilC
MGEFLSQNWPFVLIGLVILVMAYIRALKIEGFKKIVDKIFLKTPIIGPIVKSSNSAYMLRTLSSLIAAGSPLPRALEITSGTLGNFYFRSSLNESAKKVRKGEKLSEVLAASEKIYPLIIIQMIAVGEETGETSSILGNLADFFEEEVSNTTKNLASIIEPVLMIIIGVAVGFFAVSMIQPMYSMLGAI